MATFSKIDGAEPSTVTFQLATVTQDRGGQTQHQEIISVGGTESTLAVAAVLATTPGSTAWALAVREVVPQSTGTFAISSIAGRTLVDQNSTAWVAQVSTVTGRVLVDQNSTVWPVQVSSVAGKVLVDQNSTVWPVQVSSLAGAVITRSSAANMLVTAYQSTAADFLTTAIVSTVQGVVRIAGNNAADGLVHVGDSTNNALRVNVVAGAAGGSTTVNVSSLAGRVSIAGFHATDGIVNVADSTNNAINVNVVAGAAAGSTLVTVRQSTVGDFRAAVYQSTAADLNVTVAGYSTTVNVSSLAGAVIVRSSAANLLATVYQSTAADLQATVSQGSTNWSVQVSTGAVSVSTGSVTVHQGSTAFSVQARVTTSSGGALDGSTTTPAANAMALPVREVVPTLNSTTIVITSTHSTAIYSIISSVANLRHKVYAYFVGSTHTNPSTLIFCSSLSNSGFDHWHVNFGSGSSGITGANMAMNPPGFIFAGVVQNALNIKIEGGSSATSTVIARVSLAWFDEA